MKKKIRELTKYLLILLVFFCVTGCADDTGASVPEQSEEDTIVVTLPEAEQASGVPAEEGLNPEPGTASAEPAEEGTETGEKPEMEELPDPEEDPEEPDTGPAAEEEAGGDPEERKETEETVAEKADFYMTEITDSVWKRIEGKSYKADCTVPREDLRYLHVLHKDVSGVTHEGEMVCNAYIAEDLLEIFSELYEAGYPIEKMRLVDEYNADDEASMADNNSSSFNFRFISHTTKVSKHGLGLAVDINTRYNPYVKTVNGKRSVEPANGEPYTDRSGDFDYKIERDDLCCSLFFAHGFEWGGDWKSSKDYQHFEVPDSVVEKLYP